MTNLDFASNNNTQKMTKNDFNSLFAYKVNEIATYCSLHHHKSVKGGLHICYALRFIQICDLSVNDRISRPSQACIEQVGKTWQSSMLY